MKTITIQLSTPYHIYIAPNLLQSELFYEFCKGLNKRLVIITDNNLLEKAKAFQQQLQIKGLAIDLLYFPAGEKNKTRETKQILEDQLFKKQYGRDVCLIAFGGGVVTDIVGFLAATYCRGVPVVYIPTTLLAMVDASIGGKTGVNTSHGKNLVGSFTQPHAVFIDTHMLETLPAKEWHNGMAEIIKHSMIADADLFQQLSSQAYQISQPSSHISEPSSRISKPSSRAKARDPDIFSNSLAGIIHTSCLIKKTIVELDEQDNGIRQLLNFGHTIGHAIETLENYQISHGEAVAIGMLVECYLAVQLGYLSSTILENLKTVLQNYGLPLKTNAFQQKQLLQQRLTLDKKSIHSIPHFVLLEGIGKPRRDQDRYTFPVDPIYLNRALDWAAQNF